MRVMLLIMGLVGSVIGASAGEWQLVWSDDFNCQDLPDKTKREIEDGGLSSGDRQCITRERIRELQSGIVINPRLHGNSDYLILPEIFN